MCDVKSNFITFPDNLLTTSGLLRNEFIILSVHEIMNTSKNDTRCKNKAGTSYSLSRILSQAHAYAIYYDTKYHSIIFTIFIY